jgi:hypothetical protein
MTGLIFNFQELRILANDSSRRTSVYCDTGRLADADKAFSEAADHPTPRHHPAFRSFRTAYPMPP